MTRPRRSLAIGTCCGLAFASCTVWRDDSRRTVDLLDANLTPSSATARALALPAAVPVGFVGLLVDTLAVNPVYAIDDAWLDTVDVLWRSEEESSLRRALFTPLAAAATPFVFVADWFCRVTMPLPPRQEQA